MKLMVINDIEYRICNHCGSFVSSPRCLNCNPLTGSEEWIREEVKSYYSNGSNAKSIDASSIEVREGIDDRALERVRRRGRPIVKLKHHILEYFFTRDTLKRCGQYYNVPDRFLLDVSSRWHHRMMAGKKLHEHILEKKRSFEESSQSQSEWNDILERLRVDPDFFLKQVPSELLLLFKV